MTFVLLLIIERLIALTWMRVRSRYHLRDEWLKLGLPSLAESLHSSREYVTRMMTLQQRHQRKFTAGTQSLYNIMYVKQKQSYSFRCWRRVWAKDDGGVINGSRLIVCYRAMMSSQCIGTLCLSLYSLFPFLVDVTIQSAVFDSCYVITHADGSRMNTAIIRVCVWLYVCVFVRTIKPKRPKLKSPNLAQGYPSWYLAHQLILGQKLKVKVTGWHKVQKCFVVNFY